ncbi:MAG: hypothetical protein Q4D42_07440 [Eubacteriales bacterium]|nr:hypothetical protein [Eubacteriales bacterium]
MSIMIATVLEVQENILLVRERRTAQRVLVHTLLARHFRPGDIVRILYSGAMTMSIPPQITAIHITRIGGCPC